MQALQQALQQALGRRVYYGWVVVGVTVLMSLIMWGVRSAPSVLLKPLEEDFGWSRTEISSAVALASRMSALWHMTLPWGILGAGTSSGQLIFLPLLAWMVVARLRAISLSFLPFLTDLGIAGLWIFAVVYGLDWIATVPPTMTLCAELFGQRNVGTISGFVFGAHQFGAALLAFLAGYVYDRAGDYTVAFVGAGVLGLVGGLMAMRIERLTSGAAPGMPSAPPAD